MYTCFNYEACFFSFFCYYSYILFLISLISSPSFTFQLFLIQISFAKQGFIFLNLLLFLHDGFNFDLRSNILSYFNLFSHYNFILIVFRGYFELFFIERFIWFCYFLLYFNHELTFVWNTYLTCFVFIFSSFFFYAEVVYNDYTLSYY